MLLNFIKKNNPINKLFILIYYCLRPLLGPAQCRFSPTCGPYAIKQLEEQTLCRALYLICRRVWNCSPWGSTQSTD